MSSIQPYQGTNGGQLSRRASRALDGLSDTTVVDCAKVQQRALIQTQKADAVALVGSAALNNVAMISQLEGNLAQLVPLATTRLEAVANSVALALAEVVVDTASKLRSL